MSIFLRAAVLVCAAVCLVLRLVTYKYAQTLSPDVLDLMNLIAYICAGGLLVSGIAWSVTEKKKIKSPEKGENSEKNDD